MVMVFLFYAYNLHDITFSLEQTFGMIPLDLVKRLSKDVIERLRSRYHGQFALKIKGILTI